jgi:hypothetical protein
MSFYYEIPAFFGYQYKVGRAEKTKSVTVGLSSRVTLLAISGLPP